MQHDRDAEDRRRLLSNAAVAILTGFTAGTFLDRANLRAALSSSDHLHYADAQVEAVFVCGLLGLGVGLPASLLQRRLKPYYVTAIGCVGSCVGALFLWASTVSHAWYANQLVLLALFNFFTGHSVGYVYFTSLWVGFSASASLASFVSLLHHLPLVCSGLSLWLIQPLVGHLFIVQFVSALVSSLASIILLRTPARIEEPVRVVGYARNFTLPAYEFPAADTESIAESVDSDAESPRRPLVPPPRRRADPQRVRRAARALRDALPHIAAFSIAAASCLPLAQQPVARPDIRLLLSALGAVLAGAIGASSSIPRTNLLFIVLAARAIFLAFAIPYLQLSGMKVLLYGSGGFVEGAFWTMVPLLLFEARSHKRITLLWSCAMLGFAVASGAEGIVCATFFHEGGPLALCSAARCRVLVVELQLALTVVAVIATMALRNAHFQNIDRPSGGSLSSSVINVR